MYTPFVRRPTENKLMKHSNKNKCNSEEYNESCIHYINLVIFVFVKKEWLKKEMIPTLDEQCREKEIKMCHSISFFRSFCLQRNLYATIGT